MPKYQQLDVLGCGGPADQDQPPGGLVPMIMLWRGIRDNPVLDRGGVVRVLADLYHGYYAHAASDGHLQEILDRMTLVTP